MNQETTHGKYIVLAAIITGLAYIIVAIISNSKATTPPVQQVQPIPPVIINNTNHQGDNIVSDADNKPYDPYEKASNFRSESNNEVHSSDVVGRRSEESNIPTIPVPGFENTIKSSIEELNGFIKYAAETKFQNNSEREFFLDRIERRFEPNATIEVSNSKTGKISNYPIRKYFTHLTHLKDYYTDVDFSFSNIKIKDFRNGINTKYKYFSKGQFSQVFRGFIDQNEVYADITIKISEIFFYSNNDIKFGNTTIISTQEIIKQ